MAIAPDPIIPGSPEATVRAEAQQAYERERPILLTYCTEESISPAYVADLLTHVGRNCLIYALQNDPELDPLIINIRACYLRTPADANHRGWNAEVHAEVGKVLAAEWKLPDSTPNE